MQSLPAPVILTGGLDDAEQVRERLPADRRGGRDARAWGPREPVAVRAARAGTRGGPTPQEVLAELDWVIDRAVEHLGEGRATRYLRKFYPWYVSRLQLESRGARRLLEDLQSTATLHDARALLHTPERASALAV